MKRLLHFAIFSAALSTTTIISYFPVSLLAITAPTAPIIVSQNVRFKPPDVDAPDNRQGATHRGEACPEELSIIPLRPPSNDGLTVAESPTLLAYVSNNSVVIEFNLQTTEGTDKGKEVYKTTFKVDKPGIVGVRIPAEVGNQKTLEVGKRYEWSFAVACEPENKNAENSGDRSGDYYVSGLVQRVEPGQALKSDLANPDPMARTIAYAKNDIWYDTVSTLAQMLRKAPEDRALTAEWQQLLQSQKLGELAAKPLLEPL